MKPEELMLGDILEYMGTAVKVYSIGAKICVKECFGKNTYIVDFDNLLKGLELTPEILEKNGFIGDKNVCKTKIRDDSKEELWQCEYAWYLKNLRIKNKANGSVARLFNLMFVHELQHALRFCGIDKNIEI